MIFEILKTAFFLEWFEKLDVGTKNKVQIRLDRISTIGHFGFINAFDGIIELKWKSGLRIYLSYLGKKKIVVLNGGTKNGQDKDIKKAQKLIEEIWASGFVSS